MSSSTDGAARGARPVPELERLYWKVRTPWWRYFLPLVMVVAPVLGVQLIDLFTVSAPIRTCRLPSDAAANATLTRCAELGLLDAARCEPAHSTQLVYSPWLQWWEYVLLVFALVVFALALVELMLNIRHTTNELLMLLSYNVMMRVQKRFYVTRLAVLAVFVAAFVALKYVAIETAFGDTCETDRCGNARVCYVVRSDTASSIVSALKTIAIFVWGLLAPLKGVWESVRNFYTDVDLKAITKSTGENVAKHLAGVRYVKLSAYRKAKTAFIKERGMKRYKLYGIIMLERSLADFAEHERHAFVATLNTQGLVTDERA
mmetsp:Transcript_8008/g.19044  ORF Transcript_8008/g.19044 Transcript_8008/m.19044 type:complete len:318 (+) Transcript_8008:3-956(+)